MCSLYIYERLFAGDRAELEVLRDRVQSLEKQLLLNQMETDRLQDEVKVRTEVMESGDLVSREAMDRVRQERDDNEVKVTKLEQDKRQLHQVCLEKFGFHTHTSRIPNIVILCVNIW